MDRAAATENRLGSYLRDRRARLDPAAFGYPASRRRTPGLRREEVAQRAHISATWYTWLEQGRGGAPSAGVLERIADALMLTEVEREHLFLLGLGRPPEVRYRGGGDGATPRLQRVLDALDPCPAIIRTATWDVVAWNRAATVMMTDYGALPPEQRNVLRFIFLDPRVREAQDDWDGMARYVVGAFRVNAARAGADAEIEPLVQELCRRSREFEALWHAHDVHGFAEGVKRVRHPQLGALAFEYSAFAVDGRPDLTLVVHNPVDPADLERIRAILDAPRD